MDVPIISSTIYIYTAGSVLGRSGRLKYYDPMLMSDLYRHTLSTLNTVNDSVPAGTALPALPSPINIAQIDIVLAQ